MFFIISKILKTFIFPFTWILGLLIIGYFLRNKKWKKILFILSIIILVFFSNNYLLKQVQYLSTKQYINTSNPTKHYQVAIVMGGFGYMNSHTGQLCYIQDRGERIWEPVRLMQMGLIDKILITGDQTIQIDKEEHSHADIFLNYMNENNIADTCFILEQQARNTDENARNSILILDSLGYQPQDCLLVTSATHLKRSYNTFQSKGWTLDTYPVNIYSKPDKFNFKAFLPSWKSLLDWQEMLNEWVGNIVYHIFL